MKKALLFNHHPEHIWEIKRALESCGVDPYIATNRLTFHEGADYCTVSDKENDLWMRGPEWYNTSELFDDTFKYSDSLDEGFDYIFTMNKDIANRINLRDMNDLSKYTKITGHYMADRFNAQFVPRFVEDKGNLNKDRNMISQLISGDNYRHTPWYGDMIRMKSKGIPVLIAGSSKQPDGIVMDWDVLPNTSILTHYKDYGISCTCMLKALDHGIPVYMTKQQWLTQGISDIPEECFIFADDHNIEEAYNISLTADNEHIQNTFRGIKNLKSTASWMEKIL